MLGEGQGHRDADIILFRRVKNGGGKKKPKSIKKVQHISALSKAALSAAIKISFLKNKKKITKKKAQSKCAKKKKKKKNSKSNPFLALLKKKQRERRKTKTTNHPFFILSSLPLTLTTPSQTPQPPPPPLKKCNNKKVHTRCNFVASGSVLFFLSSCPDAPRAYWTRGGVFFSSSARVPRAPPPPRSFSLPALPIFSCDLHYCLSLSSSLTHSHPPTHTSPTPHTLSPPLLSFPHFSPLFPLFFPPSTTSQAIPCVFAK